MAVGKRGTRWWAKAYIKGEPFWLGTFDTEDEARLAVIEAKRSNKRRTETVGEFASRWLDDYNRSTRSGAPRWGANTVVNMRQALKPLIRDLGDIPLRELSTPVVRAWAQNQSLTYVQVARNMMNDAVGDELVDRNPFSNLRLQNSRGRRDIQVLREDEIEELCAIAEGSFGAFGPTFAAILATAAYTCIRPGELFALRPEDVQVADCELRVAWAYNGTELKRPKNERKRTIILPPPAAERIAAMPRRLHDTARCPCERRGCEACEGTGKYRPLFSLPNSRNLMMREGLYRYWNPTRIAFGRPGMDFYELRHAGATLFLERGVTPEDVAYQLGHTDGGRLVRELYGHPSDAGRRERLKRAFNQNVAPLRVADRSQREATDG